MYSNLYDPAPHSYLYGSGWPSDPPEELSLVNEPSPPTGEDYGRPQYTTVDFDPAEGNYPPDIQTHPVLNYDLTQTQVSTQHLLSQEQTQQGPIPYQPQFPYQDLPNNVLNEHPTTNFPQHPPNASYASSPLTNLDPFQEILAEALGQPPKDPTEGPMNPYHRCDYCGKFFDSEVLVPF
ncbi:hypothetical protein C8Q79DRAFT_929126 [Trametes meyenii]|nr:hypothetical protein C8Q79DRAFT_929126 [Trametes meyenii]